MPPDFSLEPKSYNLDAKFKMWSLYPFIARDIAVWVPEEIKSENVAKIIKENMGDMVIRGPELFDEFKKGNQISYAFRLVFQSYERTLTDLEVNDIMTKITNKIKENNGWQVR
jgi:phenylalanyl-tRNA synthetase beta subunit